MLEGISCKLVQCEAQGLDGVPPQVQVRALSYEPAVALGECLKLLVYKISERSTIPILSNEEIGRNAQALDSLSELVLEFIQRVCVLSGLGSDSLNDGKLVLDTVRQLTQ